MTNEIVIDVNNISVKQEMSNSVQRSKERTGEANNRKIKSSEGIAHCTERKYVTIVDHDRINNDSMIKSSEGRMDCRDVVGISENTEQLISAQKMREASAVVRSE
jgi:hypothetical protein